MLKVTFDLIPIAYQRPISGLSRGHLTIQGEQGSATSVGQHPDQSMMIFLAIVELLDGLRRFIQDRNSLVYRFIGADSSFQFLVTKMGNHRLRLEHGPLVIDEVVISELVQAVLDGIDALMVRDGRQLGPDDAVAKDLQSALKDFEQVVH